MTAVSTVEVTDAHDGTDPGSWMVIETAEQGQLLLNLPGPLYDAMVQATQEPDHRPGPGRLALTHDEVVAYQNRVDQLTRAR
ncbi:hypothetical protein [Streptomyces sp. NPDC048650]|uniref:hypothetical protein n=1 Tax=unclassified Streptomyces TaxID=2593676 RepID=UPI003724784E